MRSASYQHAAYRGRASRRSRAMSLLLALALVALMIALLIQLGFLPTPLTQPEPSLSTFDVSAGQQLTDPRAHKAARAPRAHAAPPPRPTPVTPTPPTPVATPAPSTKLLTMSRDEFASTDIGKIKGQADSSEGADDGKDSVAAYGPGEGPGGARLYDAQWYTEPTHTQLAYYLKPGTPAGRAYIECQTIEHYHVENCRELGETPPGAGIARALRQAAWQFLVRPPRRGGKPLIGAWVRIRFDLTLVGADDAPSPHESER